MSEKSIQARAVAGTDTKTTTKKATNTTTKKTTNTNTHEATKTGTITQPTGFGGSTTGNSGTTINFVTTASSSSEPKTGAFSKHAPLASAATSSRRAANAGSQNAPIHARTRSSGLSTGAAIGIGIAISVFFIVLLCVLGFLWYRRHTRRKRAGGPTQASQARHGDARGESGITKGKRKGGSKDGRVGKPCELSGKLRAGELETSANRHELDARSREDRIHELRGESEERKDLDYTENT